MPLPPDPNILVLLVASDGARWLPEAIAGVKAQGRAAVLCVDNASTDGSGALLEEAFGSDRLVMLERRVGYGRALAAAMKVVADRGIEADAFLLVHDDAAMAPGALDAMIEVMREPDVGIVGAKLVDWDDPARLQEIGLTTDRYGRAVARVDRGEIDQGQHDGRHEVLYASSAVLLVAREVVERVGLFDLRYVAFRDDLDLCWRARIGGWRAVVTSGATARHVAASARDLRPGPNRGRARFLGDRNMIATLIKNYGLPRMLFAVPFTIAISIANVVLYLVRGRRRAALQVLEALWWNLVHLPSTLRARRRVQAARTAPDRAVTILMHHGATRLRDQVERAIETVVGQVEEGAEEDLDAPPPRMIDRIRRHPGAALLIVLAGVYLTGARELFLADVVAGGDLRPFPPGPSGFFREYLSGWHGAGGGGAGPATPGLFLLGLYSLVSFGSTWLAARALPLVLVVMIAAAARRLARAAGLGPAGARVAAVVAVLSPATVGAFSSGGLLDLVLLAAGPLLLIPILRAARLAPRDGWRQVALGVAGLALAASLSPWALVLVLVFGAAAAIGSGAPRASLVRAGVMVAGALVLLLPWSAQLFGPGSPLRAGARAVVARAGDLWALSPGGFRAVPFAVGFGFTAIAVAGLVVPHPAGRVRAVLGVAGGAGLVMAWLVSRGIPLAPRPSLALAPAGVVLPVLAGGAFEATVPVLRRRAFGLRHVAAALAGGAFLAQAALTGLWVAAGNLERVAGDDRIVPAFFAGEETELGPFRVGWVGADGPNASAALTGPEGASMRTHLAPDHDAGTGAFRTIVASVLSGTTDTAGRSLAALGVRYVILRPDTGDAVREAFTRQPDLLFAQRFNDAIVLRNEAWLPVMAAVPASRWVDAMGAGSEALGTVEVPPPAVVAGGRPRPGSYRGTMVRRTRAVFLAEDPAAGWTIRAGDQVAAGEPTFGFATFARVRGERADVTVSYDGQGRHRLAVAAQLLLVLGFAFAWSARAGREQEAAAPVRARTRAEVPA